ncbi:hypothetical protein [Pseudomonas pseudonitroreducens]|uniref:hypothetical protein n=1 Tax=Pseudomonas pseudonitroreducens TaxID=2892326 RepID=UPI001F36D1C0|nr:hypothetical protein [Pseudomonas pseudonitroreducens]
MSYQNVLNGAVNLAAANFNGPPAVASLGRQFVMSCLLARLTPANHMVQINNRFHQFLSNRGWRWEPGVAGASYIAGARLLDGTVTQGECGFPAYALAYLIQAPPPYGFGMGIGSASVITYRGTNNSGFISDHANALPGPQPNITSPAGAPLAGFYYWANHKVVQYAGQIYDPCYNAVYATPAGMAAASLLTVRQRARLRDLENYDPASPWGLLLGWGLPRLTALKISDLLWGNSHTITVTQAVNVTDNAVNGHFIEWDEQWARPGLAGRGNIYGPIPHNPLVR